VSDTTRLATMLVAAAVAFGSTLHGQTPQPKSQAPGFYRMMLGKFEIVALNDGVVPYPSTTVLPTVSPETIESSLFSAGLTDPVGMSYNAFLVNTGSKIILIDTGTGGKVNEIPAFRGAGRLLANLRAAGYEPAQVDEVYITHMGPDHVGGLTLGSERTFPNAVLRVAKREVDAFLDPGRATSRDSMWYRFRSDLFEPYERAGKLETFDQDVTLAPGIRALATHGHTPGHSSFVVESDGQRLIVLGDVVHLGAVQFAHPSLPTNFDADREGGAAQRQRIFQLAAEGDYWVAGAHLSFPGLGHVRSEQGRFHWAPANYTIP
jgi:glyoxylase-like metal-dependent hydrolase (beta-lactamase superfamily II)